MTLERIETSMTVSVPVILMLVQEDDVHLLRPDRARPAVADDLRLLRWRHWDDIYDRLKALFEAAGVKTDEGNGGWLRHLIVWVAMYEYDLDGSDPEILGRIVAAADAAGANGEAE